MGQKKLARCRLIAWIPRLAIHLLFWLVAVTPCISFATDSFIQSQDYWIGESPENTKNVHWQTFQRYLALGYGSEPVWIRLHVAPEAGKSPDQSIEINIRPGFLDQIDLYDPLLAKTAQPSVGDRLSWSNNARPSFTYNFSVPIGAEPRTLVLRVKTSSTRLIDISALTPAEAQNDERELLTALSFVLYSLCAFLVWATYNWITHRDRLSGDFVLLQLASVGYSIVILGFARVYLSNKLSPETLDTLTSLAVLTYCFTCIWFYIRLISEYGIKVWALRILWTLLALSIPVLAIYLFSAPWLGLMLNTCLMALSCIALLLCSLFAIPWKSLPSNPSLLPKKILVGYFLILFLVNWTHAYSILGFGCSTSLSFYGAIHNALMTGLLLSMVLYVRSKKIDHDRKQKLIREQARADHERQQRTQQSQFMDMLAHELNTPLSVISLAIGLTYPSQKLRELAANGITNIKELINRCVQASQVNEIGIPLHKESINLEALIGSLIHNRPESERIHFQATYAGEILGDKKWLSIAVNNLIDNAIKYGSKEDCIDVDLSTNADRTSINIAIYNDIGQAGLPDQNKVFEKYYRSESAHHETGSGLGLFLSKNLVEMHNGNIHYTVVNKRICFTICIPLAA